MYDIYEEWYLEGLDEKNFIEVYDVFKRYGFYFIDDIILNYLDIFCFDREEVEDGILDLKKELEDSFVSIIGNDMRYLEKILEFI